MISSLGMVIAAFTGSLLAMAFVLVISFKIKNMSILVVCGIMIGYICSAITDFCVTFASDSNIVNLHNWSMGSFSGMSWDNIKVMSVIVVITVTATFFLSKPISAYQLGEAYGAQYGCECPDTAYTSHIIIKPFVGMCDSVRRPYIVRRDCSTTPCKDNHENCKTDSPYTGMFSGRGGNNTVL